MVRNRSLRATTAMVAGVLAIGLAACEPTTPTTPSVPVGGSPTTTTTTAPSNTTWKLIGGDEFNGTSVDTSKWKVYFNNYGDGGGSTMQCNTPNNVTEGGGVLNITARRQTVQCPNGGTRTFTTGFLGTREVGKYFPRFARFEMRAKMPHGQGLWPGFWLRHRNGASTAEVDIMEYLHTDKPGMTSGTVHLDGRYNLSKKYVYVEAPTADPAWHTWAVDIEPAGDDDVKFSFSMDGTVYHTYTDTQHKWASADPQATWDMAVDMAVSGDWTGMPDDPLGYLRNKNTCAQGGTAPNGCTATGVRRATFPITYSVDWVRVYVKQ